MQASPFASQEDTTVEALVSTVRRQLDADCELGLFSHCPPSTLDQIAARSVELLWGRSRIRAFLPLLALRQAREELRYAAESPNPGPYTHRDQSIDDMLHDLDGLIGLRLTLTHDDQWHAVLFYRQEGVDQRTVRAVASRATMDEAVCAVILQAKGLTQ